MYFSASPFLEVDLFQMALFFKDESMTLMPASLENGFLRWPVRNQKQHQTIPCFGDATATTSGYLRLLHDLRIFLNSTNNQHK
jgi:hypothetical protein